MSTQPQPDQPIDKHDPYAAFRIPAYRIYVIGWFFAMIGTRIQSVAIGWEMYQRTGEALSLGLVGLAQALPTMLLALPAGYLADRFNRPKLVIFSLLGMTVTSAGLAVLSYQQGSTTWMYILLALDASAVILGRPARVALLPQLVSKIAFANAITWNTSLSQITGVIGPALGGVIIAAIDPSFAFVVAAASSLIFVLVLMRFRFGADIKNGEAPSLQGFLAGIHFVWNTRIILTMITLDLFAVLLGGAVYLLPIFAEDILQVGASGFGWLRAAPAVGAFCMAFAMIYLPPLRRTGWSLLISVGAFGVATIIFGLTKSFWVALAMLFLTGAFDNVSMVIRQTAQLLLTPDHMRGRVSAVTSVFVGASNELGGLESGVVAQAFGPIFSVVSGGIGTLLVVALTAWWSPELRNLGSMHNIKPVEADPPEGKTAVASA